MRKHNTIKKLIAGALSVITICSLTFTGCKKDTENQNTNTQKEQVSDQEVQQVRKEFDEYMNELFIKEMSASSVSTHFSLENPEDYGITFDETTRGWGQPVTIEYIEQSYVDQMEILKKLKTFDSSLLDDTQQITYDTVYEYIENLYSIKDLYLFDELFSPINGMQAQIPLIFSEYDLFTVEDIEDYIYLMETVDDYLNSLIEYEKYRAEKGYFLTDAGADDVIQQCKDFIEPETNCLVDIFDEKLTAFGVSEADKSTYMDRFETAIKENLIPAYENIIDTLETLKGSRATQLGLSEFDNGAEYYEALVRNFTGSDKSVEELIEVVEQSLADSILLVHTLMSDNPDIFTEFDEFEYPSLDTEATIEMQIEKAKKYFPETDAIPYEVKDVPESLEASMSPAFYLVPPIDNKDKNMIYINNSEEYAHMNLFSTLAHEGVPGHMYQCYYYSSTNPAPIRNVLSFSGYNEGWATYVEYYSYEFAGMNSALAAYAAANDRYAFALYSRIDLGIHYEGWDLEDVKYFLGIYGSYDDELALDIYNTLIDDPAVYLQYYIGYLEIDELRQEAEDKVEAFDIIEFHKFILDMGPTFFDIIDDEMDSWIRKQNAS